MNNFQDKVNFIWSVADLLRDDFKRGKYPDVILPFTVLRRVDCVLEPTKTKALQRYEQLKGKIENLAGQLTRASGYSFYNISPYDFQRLLDDPKNVGKNLRTYMNGFSENMREILDKFDFRTQIGKLEEANLLYLVLQRFAEIDLHPNAVSNLEMGYIFEELIRKFNEAMNENPGEHFTPREVIRLMVNLLFRQDKDVLSQNHVVRTVYDPACGTGGMLTIAKDYILELNPNADIHLFGQEVNPETFAVCKSDLLIKSKDGRDADNIKFGSCFSQDGFPRMKFDYMLSNPPYGKDWKKEKEFIEDKATRGYAGRFSAGLPRISDGQLLFLQHMISKMKDPHETEGSRLAIVMNGSPLFTGDAGSGESEIRRWILEKDWLEAIVALPDQLFYNTGIHTYVWLLTNRKEVRRKGKVQLINAISFYVKMRKSLGDKRNEISDEQIQQITDLYDAFEENEHCKIFDREDVGYRKMTVERPLRLNFQASPERIARLKLREGEAPAEPNRKRRADGSAGASPSLQAQILAALSQMDATLYKNRDEFERALDAALVGNGRRAVPAPVRKAILNALSERDETADICRDKDGNPDPDPALRDYENVPLKEDITAYFEREVRPHVSDAFINKSVRDEKDGKVGKVGCEINFNRTFYQYQPPRPLGEIDADIKALEQEILAMLREVTG